MKIFIICILSVMLSVVWLQSESFGAQGLLVTRQAMQDSLAAVGIEAYLQDDIMQVKVTVKMKGTKPKIYDVLFEGKGIGRLSPIEIDQLYASTEEEPPYETTKRGGFISFGDKTEKKKLKGRTVRKLVSFRIPNEKILPDRTYFIIVKVEDTNKRGKVKRYRFGIKGFAKQTASSSSVDVPSVSPAVENELPPDWAPDWVDAGFVTFADVFVAPDSENLGIPQPSYVQAQEPEKSEEETRDSSGEWQVLSPDSPVMLKSGKQVQLLLMKFADFRHLRLLEEVMDIKDNRIEIRIPRWGYRGDAISNHMPSLWVKQLSVGDLEEGEYQVYLHNKLAGIFVVKSE